MNRYPKNRHYNPTPSRSAGSASGANYLTIERELTSAEIKALNTTPIQLIPAPGAGFFIAPRQIIKKYNYGTIQYATNTSLLVSYESDLATDITSNLNFAVASDAVASQPVTQASGVPRDNKAIFAYVNFGNPTAGDGTIKVRIDYTIESV